MDKYKETLETWNKVADLYQQKFMNLAIYNDTYDIICKCIKKLNAKVLDIGCGPGNITSHLLSKRPDLDILGIDAASNMINLAKKNNPNSRFDILDARNIIELDSKYDAIVCGFCIPYLSPEDLKKLIFDASNLLNEAGLLYLSFVEGDPIKSGFITSSVGYRTYFYFHSTALIKSMLSKNSLNCLKEIRIEYKKSNTENETHIILIATKDILSKINHG